MSTRPSEQHQDEGMPEGAVVDGERLTRSIDDVFDVVIVGSGAAGATAAYTLTKAGLSVGIVEEGPWLETRDMTKDVHTTFGRVMRQAGMQVLQGGAYMPLLQGRCVGGSTLVNSAIAWRIPEDVADDWSARFSLGDEISMRVLEPHFEALERDLSVREVDPSVLGENNRLFVQQATKFGVPAAPMRRYDRACQGSGFCLTGCPHGAKQGMSVTYVPWALLDHRKRARIFTSCRVERVDIAGRRAVGVRARSESGHLVNVRARRAVIVAASTVQTPGVLRRSGIRASALGKHFQVHPGLAVGGLFDRTIEMGFGATQGAESTHFRKTERFKLETISLPPDLAGARIPGHRPRAHRAPLAALPGRGVGRPGARRGRRRGRERLRRRRPRQVHDDQARSHGCAEGVHAHRAHAVRCGRPRGVAGHLRDPERAPLDGRSDPPRERPRSIRTATTSSRRTSSAPLAWERIRGPPWSGRISACTGPTRSTWSTPAYFRPTWA